MKKLLILIAVFIGCIYNSAQAQTSVVERDIIVQDTVYVPHEVIEQLGDTPTIDYRPADDLEPELDKFRDEIKEYYEQEEDVLSYAVFQQVALNFFKYRQAKKYGVDSQIYDKNNKVLPV